MGADTDLQFYAFLWLALAAYLVVRHWRPGAGVGLLLTYVVSFGSIQWLAAALYLLPWYRAGEGTTVAEGLRVSALAMCAFAVGAELAAWLYKRRVQSRPGEEVTPDAAAVSLYLGVGLGLYIAIAPFGGSLPSVSALVSTGSTLVIVGLALKFWQAWRQDRSFQAWRWVAVAAMMPFFTVITQGFLGYGMAALLAVFAFAVALYGPKLRLALIAAALLYFGLSVYVTYMRDRGELRDAVWSGASLTARMNQLQGGLSNMEWFDPYNNQHLNRIDIRLNQDFLVGAAVAYMSADRAPFAHGATVLDAVASLVPRALWPDKPMTAGSGNLVSTYTGMHFAEGTSVGIGQVMESYVNFGIPGVLGGFLLIGFLVATADRAAARALVRGDVKRFTLWYLPAVALLQVGGSFVELMSMAGSGLVMAVLLNRVIDLLPRRQPVPLAPQPSEAPR